MKLLHFEVNISVVVVDFSFAILNALCYALNNLNLEEQIKLQWQSIKNGDEINLVFLRLCVSHYIHSIVRSASKLSVTAKVCEK